MFNNEQLKTILHTMREKCKDYDKLIKEHKEGSIEKMELEQEREKHLEIYRMIMKEINKEAV